MGNDVRRAINKMLFVNAPAWGRGDIVTYLNFYGFPCSKKNGMEYCGDSKGGKRHLEVSAVVRIARNEIMESGGDILLL